MSVKGHFEPPQLLIFESDAVPDPAFDSDAEPDPATQNEANPDWQHFLTRLSSHL